MSWTLARHCKVTVDKTLRCRGRVFLYLHDTGTELYELWQSQLIQMITVIKYLFTQVTLLFCPVLGKCRLRVYAIGLILCKYSANTD